MGRGKRLDDFEKGGIVALRAQELSNRAIAKAVARSSNVVNNSLRDPVAYSSSKPAGPAPQLTEHDVCQLRRTAAEREESLKVLAASLRLPVGDRRVRQVLNATPHLTFTKRKNTPKLEKYHVAARLSWAIKRVSWRPKWHQVVFSDEKKFNLDGPYGFQYYWHDLRNEPQVYSTRQMGGGSVMVWWAFPAAGKSALAVLEGRQDNARYQRTLEQYLLPFVRPNHPAGYVFQQDNASIHTAGGTKIWFQTHSVDVMPWPAKSPDLSSIENHAFFTFASQKRAQLESQFQNNPKRDANLSNSMLNKLFGTSSKEPPAPSGDSSKTPEPSAVSSPSPSSVPAAAGEQAQQPGFVTLTLPADVLAFVVASELSESQKRGFAGLCAYALPDVNDGSPQLQWSKTYLALVVIHFLGLEGNADGANGNSSALDAFLPMLTVRQEDTLHGYNSAEHTKMLDPAPYLELLTPSSPPAEEQHESSGWSSLFGSNKAPAESAVAPGITPAKDMAQAFRFRVVKQLLWFTVKVIGYDARARTLFRRLAHFMDLQWQEIAMEEGNVGRALFAEATAMPLEKLTPSLNLKDWKRKAAIGAAAITGGALLAVTGGLAAPAIAGSLVALGEAGVVAGTLVGSASGVTATSVLFGAAGAGVVGKKTDTRTRGVQEFHFDLLSAGDGMSVFICISGWLDKDDPPAGKGLRRPWGDSREYLLVFYREHSPDKVDQLDQILARYEGREGELFKSLRESYKIQNGSPENDPLGLREEAPTAGEGDDMKKKKSHLSLPKLSDSEESEKLRAWRWKDRFPQGDQYCVVWEEQLLHDFGDEMRSFAVSYAKDKLVSAAGDELLTLGKLTVLAALLSAVALPKSLLDMADIIDNVWTLTLNAADEAGKILAQTLLTREQGLRPVTLVGFGMGARMIASCLKELSKKPEGEACGIIENAVLLGASVAVDKDDWKSTRRIVSGRLINGFSENDWMLAIMYRYQGWALNCAGISAIKVDGVENVDLSSVITSHFDYKDKVSEIVDLLKLESE